MGSFFKSVFSSCLGTILAFFFCFLVLMIIGTISGMGKNNIESNSVLLLDFQGLLPEKTNNVQSNSSFNFETPSAMGVFEMIDYIKHAATDDRISQIVLKPENSSMGFAKMIQLADALDTLREKCDKPIYAYGDFYTQSGYLLSSEADSVFLNPEGGIDFRGFGVSISFAKEFLEKIGVKMNVFYAGEFKSAAEVYYRNDMSENSKLQTREFLSALHDNYLDRITENRNLDHSILNHALDNYTFSNADSTLAYGAVDGLTQWFEFENILRRNMDLKKGKKINYITIDEYKKKTSLSRKGKGKDRIAVVFAEGEIRYNQEGNGLISEMAYHKIFDKIRKDENVKAVVFRVSSPGGSSYTSEAILQEVRDIQASGIPVVASFGNYAASGGYYISCSADTIVSEANTITGSIGAFSVFPEANELFEEKLGIHIDTVKTAEYAVGFNPMLKLTEPERRFIDKSNKRIYNTFLNRVADGRGMTFEDVEKIAEGRVYTGERALELGLVDVIGNLDNAIEIAADMAGMEKYKIKEYPVISTPKWIEFLEAFSDQASLSKIFQKFTISKELEKLKETVEMYKEHRVPMMLLPFELKF